MARKAKSSRYFGMTRTEILILLSLSILVLCLGVVLISLFTGGSAVVQVRSSPATQTVSTIFANIDLSVTQTADNKVLVNGSTNLPDETIIMVSMDGITSDYSAQDRVIVANGKFRAGLFSSLGSGLDGGKYLVKALMPYPSVQSEAVRKIIGQGGENLAGEQVIYEDGVLVRNTEEFAVVIPTPSPLPLPTVTPAPPKIIMTGGDIGKGWSNDEQRVSLLSVYRTESLDGVRPFGERNGGYRGGFTQFLVVELQFDRYSSGYDEYQLSKFWLWSISDNNDVEYQAESYLYQSPSVIEVYYQEKARAIIAFEVTPDSHNFIMCYWTGVAMDMAGKMVYGCGAPGYQFNFGD